MLRISLYLNMDSVTCTIFSPKIYSSHIKSTLPLRSSLPHLPSIPSSQSPTQNSEISERPYSSQPTQQQPLRRIRHNNRIRIQILRSLPLSLGKFHLTPNQQLSNNKFIHRTRIPSSGTRLSPASPSQISGLNTVEFMDREWIVGF